MDFWHLITRTTEILRNRGPRSLVRTADSYLKRRTLRKARNTATKNYRLSKTYFRTMTRIRYLLQQRHYSQPAHPYKVLEIDTTKVDTYLKYNTQGISYLDGLGQITGGEWETTPLRSYQKYRGLEQRFREGLSWRKTEYVDWARQRFIEGYDFGYENLDDFIDTRCDYIDNLYHDIRTSGYQPNYTRANNTPDVEARSKYYHSHLEPFVAIDSKGKIHLCDGFHRFAIASILEISVPVYVVLRHSEWAKCREEFVKNNTYGNLDHPDLQDLKRDPVIWY